MWKVLLSSCVLSMGLFCLGQSATLGRAINEELQSSSDAETSLLSEPAFELQMSIIEAKVTRQVTKLIPVFQGESSSELLQQAILTAGQIGDPIGLELIKPYLKSPEHQSIALFAWGECGGSVPSSSAENSKITGESKSWNHALVTLVGLTVFNGNELKWFEAVSKLAPGSRFYSKELKDKVWETWQGYSKEVKTDALFFAWHFNDKRFEDEVLSLLKKGWDSYGLIYFIYRKKMDLPQEIFSRVLEKKVAIPNQLLKLLQCKVTGYTDEHGTLGSFLNHPDWRVRVETIKFLSRNKLLDSKWYLLDDPNPNVIRTFLAEFLQEGGIRQGIESQLIRRWQRFSPALKWAVIQSIPQIDQPWLLLEIDNWTRSKMKWKHLKGITSLGKTTGTQRRERDDKRLRSYFESGSNLEKLIAFTSAKELQSSWFKDALFSDDPFLMAAAFDSITDEAEKEGVTLEEPEWDRLAETLLLEPDIQYTTLKPLEKLISSLAYTEMLQRLLLSPHYLVRLKAIEASGGDDRSSVFSSAWQTGMPETYLRAGAFLLGANQNKYWNILTEKGMITIQLFLKDAPVTCTSIMALARKKYFNAMAIHRVVPDFVLQAGDPRGDGSGGPGYLIPCEINTKKYKRGAVGMALAGKDTGGSQFFICHSAQPHLDGGYSVFGNVVQGMAVVDSLVEGDLIVSSFITSELIKR